MAIVPDYIFPMVKQIPEFPGYYASLDGRIWSNKRQMWLKPGVMNNPNSKSKGRLFVALRKNNKSFYRTVHRLILETYVGPRPSGMECCHNNDNPADNRLENLRWDTHENNLKDRKRNGINQGEAVWNSKLKEFEVREIIDLYKSGLFSQRKIAKLYGVSHSTVGFILIGKNWKHISC